MIRALASLSIPAAATFGLLLDRPVEVAASALVSTWMADALLARPRDADAPPAAWIDLVPVVHVLWLSVLVVWAAWWVSDPGRPWFQRVGLAPAFGVYACTSGVNACHELIHRRARWQRKLGGVAAALVGYGTFAVEHVRGHHVHVATAEDPSSAAQGIGVWSFLPGAVAGNVGRAIQLERRRLACLGRSPWTLHNEVIQWTGLTVFVGASLTLAFGAAAGIFFLVQGLVATASLEINNYVEHYGLRRARRPSGAYEPVGRHHSWCGDHAASDAVFLSLPRHADHHLRPGRTFTTLRHLENTPQLPASYATMYVVAMVPPLWFAWMDPRVAEVRSRQARPRVADCTDDVLM